MTSTPLRARGVDVAYGVSSSRSTVLHGVDVDVAPNEILAVVGPNGAGKTTLLRALAGTQPIARGTIELAGRSIAELPRDEMARSIAVVAQELPLAEGFTAREVVAMGRAPHQRGWMRPSARDEAIVDEALARCDVLSLADRSFSELSGGERKRVVLAQAFAQSPRVLLLDEPTAFLDLGHAEDLFALLRAACNEGLAVVATVHDLSLAARHADRALLLVEGRVLADGPASEVLTPARLGEAFGVSLVRLVDEASNAVALVAARRAREVE